MEVKTPALLVATSTFLGLLRCSKCGFEEWSHWPDLVPDYTQFECSNCGEMTAEMAGPAHREPLQAQQITAICYDAVGALKVEMVRRIRERES